MAKSWKAPAPPIHLLDDVRSTALARLKPHEEGWNVNSTESIHPSAAVPEFHDEQPRHVPFTVDLDAPYQLVMREFAWWLGHLQRLRQEQQPGPDRPRGGRPRALALDPMTELFFRAWCGRLRVAVEAAWPEFCKARQRRRVLRLALADFGDPGLTGVLDALPSNVLNSARTANAIGLSLAAARLGLPVSTLRGYLRKPPRD